MDKAYLSSSVTVSCSPNIQEGYVSFKEVKKNIEKRVKKEVKLLYEYGFRGADLLTACFGQAVSEFGQYQTVEKADGTNVTVAELLELARDAAFNAIISDIDTDEVTTFYIGWLNLFGFTQTEHDDVMRITQVGLSVEVSILHQYHIFEIPAIKKAFQDIKNDARQTKNWEHRPTRLPSIKYIKECRCFRVEIVHALTEFLGMLPHPWMPRSGVFALPWQKYSQWLRRP